VARHPVYYNGAAWSSLEFPDDLFTFGPAETFMTALWAASADEAYATAFAEDPGGGPDGILVVGWDGAVWSALPEQPATVRRSRPS